MPTINLLKSKRDSVPTKRKGQYQKIYQDKRWKNLRDQKFKSNPICERCESLGRVTPTEEVHHKIPFDYGKYQDEINELAFDWENLESVCSPCHEFRHKELKNNS
jgi:5-methylcytosine-specific restriction enzyme A